VLQTEQSLGYSSQGIFNWIFLFSALRHNTLVSKTMY
jgi:hypothetical protein